MIDFSQRYFVVALAARSKEINSHLLIQDGMASADEARGRALRMLAEKYPTRDGWMLSVGEPIRADEP